VLGWDERTMMPPAGAAARAQVMGTLARVRHQRFASDEVGELIEAARPEAAGQPHDSVEAALLRVVSRDYEKARRIPAELRAEMAEASSIAEAVWVEAGESPTSSCFSLTSSETSSSPVASPVATRASRTSRARTTRCWTSTSPA
jgi:carboxypeptidase Taq